MPLKGDRVITLHVPDPDPIPADKSMASNHTEHAAQITQESTSYVLLSVGTRLGSPG